MRRTLYHREASAQCEKVRLALALGGIDYDSVVVDEADRGQLRKLSGQEQVPVLVEDDGRVLHDANLILRHLAKRPGARLLPDARRDQSLAWVLVDRADRILGGLVCRLTRRREPGGTSLGEEDLGALERELAVLEGLLDRGPYLFVGDRPTVADICAHAYLSRLVAMGKRPLPPSFQRVSSWYTRLDEVAGSVPRGGRR